MAPLRVVRRVPASLAAAMGRWSSAPVPPSARPWSGWEWRQNRRRSWALGAIASGGLARRPRHSAGSAFHGTADGFAPASDRLAVRAYLGVLGVLGVQRHRAGDVPIDHSPRRVEYSPPAGPGPVTTCHV